MTLDFVVKGRCVNIYYCVNINYSFLLSIVHLLISHLACILLLREDVSIFIMHVHILPVVHDIQYVYKLPFIMCSVAFSSRVKMALVVDAEFIKAYCYTEDHKKLYCSHLHNLLNSLIYIKRHLTLLSLFFFLYMFNSLFGLHILMILICHQSSTHTSNMNIPGHNKKKS